MGLKIIHYNFHPMMHLDIDANNFPFSYLSESKMTVAYDFHFYYYYPLGNCQFIIIKGIIITSTFHKCRWFFRLFIHLCILYTNHLQFWVIISHLTDLYANFHQDYFSNFHLLHTSYYDIFNIWWMKVIFLWLLHYSPN